MTPSCSFSLFVTFVSFVVGGFVGSRPGPATGTAVFINRQVWFTMVEMPTRPIQHRRARRTDFAAVNALMSGCGVPIPEAGRAGLRRFRHLVADLGGDLYVALVDERVVGVVHVSYTRHLLHGQQAWLALLAVAPDARRQGIGRSLAALASARARRRGCSSLWCAPHTAGADAAAFLAALGWRARHEQFEFDLPGSAQ